MSISASMGSDAHFVIELADANDPQGPLEAFFVDHGEPPRMIAGSFGASDADFGWLIRGFATWHQRPLIDNTSPKRVGDVIGPDRRPHSKACGVTKHEHGLACSRNCPTCGGQDMKGVTR